MESAWHALSFDQPQPPELTAAPGVPTSATQERRAPLASLRWCALTPNPQDRMLLVSGFELDPTQLGAPEDPALLAAIPEAPPAGFFARLLGARDREGVALTLRCAPGQAAPDGWLPWLRFHQERDLEFHCWGTEGGGELELYSAPSPSVPPQEALLEVLRSHALIEREQFAELYEIWLENEGPTEPGLTELVAGAPERGFWQRVPLEEMEDVLVARSGDRDRTGVSHLERVLPGSALIAQLRNTVHEPLAIALHVEPTNDAVVVWFIVGGVSKISGQLECLLTERVWS